MTTTAASARRIDRSLVRLWHAPAAPHRGEVFQLLRTTVLEHESRARVRPAWAEGDQNCGVRTTPWPGRQVQDRPDPADNRVEEATSHHGRSEHRDDPTEGVVRR